MTSPVVVHIVDARSDLERVYIGRAIPRRGVTASAGVYFEHSASAWQS
jgi:hypothetical protein